MNNLNCTDIEAISITLHGCNIARCGGFEHKARGMSGAISPLARKMIEAGVDPFTWVEVWRDQTKCFPRRALIHWASVHTSEGFSQSVKTSAYKPRPEVNA